MTDAHVQLEMAEKGSGTHYERKRHRVVKKRCVVTEESAMKEEG